MSRKSTLATLESTHESTHQAIELKGNPRLPRFNARACRKKRSNNARAREKNRSVRKTSVASVASVDLYINHHVSNTVKSGYSVDSSVDLAQIHSLPGIKEAKPMKFDQIDTRRRQICESWGLFRHSDPLAQMIKLDEERDELHQALQEADYAEIIDAIGDQMVVLGNIATMVGADLAACYAGAVEEISQRKGSIVDGVFVKDQA